MQEAECLWVVGGWWEDTVQWDTRASGWEAEGPVFSCGAVTV